MFRHFKPGTIKFILQRGTRSIYVRVCYTPIVVVLKIRIEKIYIKYKRWEYYHRTFSSILKLN